MTDIERIELAIRRVLGSTKTTDPINLLRALADELACMKTEDRHARIERNFGMPIL